MEAAKASGYTTGIVVRSNIFDATPGAFSSHVLIRKSYDEIISQQVGNGPFGR